MPPVHLVFLLIPAFVGWLWMLGEARNWRAAFGVGWWFGLGHFAAGLYWIANALLVQPEKFAWLIPFAVIGIAAAMAVFPALVAVVVRAAGSRGIGGVLVLAVAWCATEWLRSWIFTGFPWNLMGTVWAFDDAMIQSAALFGAFGLGLITVAIAAMPAILGEPGVSARCSVVALCGALALLVVLWGGGAARLADATIANVPNVTLRLVQPNIPQKLKWRRDLRDHNLARQVALSVRESSGGEAPTHVIWAETAATFFLGQDNERRDFLAKAAPPGGSVIVGAPRRTPPGDEIYRVWNSLQALDGSGQIVGRYDKFHLVPFGEYIPLRPWLTIPKLTAGRQDFSPGDGLATLSLPGLPPVSPLICYEVIFPGAVARRDDRPQWMLNLTNDAWYGVSSGPYQHLAAARMRAVEEGLPLVRVANTGISAIVDAYGRTVAQLGLQKVGVLDAPLPAALEPTPYSRFGNALTLGLALFGLAASQTGRVWRRTLQSGR
ncbi:MAG: apolipoprotein N-acyltransferase [Alphaproteobacteria bacterium]|nr:apolipoprotein N-acyltransferase [Alphaproteobacteria bacterium]